MKNTNEIPAGSGRPDHLHASDLLSDRQHKAIDQIILGVPIVAVAMAVGVARSTLYTWLRQPAFVVVLNERRALVRQELTAEIITMFRGAVTGIITALEGGDTKTALATLHLLDLNPIVSSNPGPTSMDQVIDGVTDERFRSKEQSLRNELTVRSIGSVMDDIGMGRDSIRAETAEGFRLRAESDLADELAAIRAGGSNGTAQTDRPPGATRAATTRSDHLEVGRLFSIDSIPIRPVRPRGPQRRRTGEGGRAAAH